MRIWVSSCTALAFITTIGIGFSGQAHAQKIRINYDALSSLEEPLAFSVGEVTVLVSGAVDAPVKLHLDPSALAWDKEVTLRSNIGINAETQLGNRWTVGVSYFGQYDVRDNVYGDNVVGYVRTTLGSFIGGNTAGLVREQTRRARGFGNAALAFDNFYGGLSRWGGAYIGRFGPVSGSVAFDEFGNFDVGAVFQRPIGNKDYRMAVRVSDGQYLSADASTKFDTAGVNMVGELVFGSSRFDIRGGFERLKSNPLNLDRWFLSGGMQTKTGVISLSAEGHYGELDGSPEASASLGIAYDIARGISTNLGINARKAQIARNGINVIDEKEASAVASIRYSF